ncbi:hypothetical protein ACF0H5_015799 [Mactra antiquata]
MRNFKLYICAFLLTSTSFSKAAFRVYNEQTIRPWTMHFSVTAQDCTPAGLLMAFPTIYSRQNNANVQIEPARNFIVNQTEREALELGAPKNRFYPGALVSFLPPQNGLNHVTGYELILKRNNSKFCVVLDFSNIRWNSEDEIELELFPMQGLSHYQVILSTLPKYRPEQASPVQHIATSEFGRIQTPAAQLLPSANWFAAVSYYIINNRNDDTVRRSLEIVFSRPPREYNFDQFEIALVSRNNGRGIRKAVTGDFYYVFEDVPTGVYKIMLWPIDEYFSQPGRCLCQLADGACTNCVATAVEGITVP